MLKDIQTTIQVDSFHMLVRPCSKSSRGFPGGGSSKEPPCQCRKHKRWRFNPWVGKSPWRRKWLPTPVFLTGESHGQRSLEGYSPQGHKESNMTGATCSNNESLSVMSDSLQPHGLHSPWNSPEYQSGQSFPSPGESSLRIQTQVSCIVGGFFTS